MQLIENDEVQATCICDYGLVERVLARHQKLEHHKISQQNIGLGLPNLLPLCVIFLARIARECWT